MHELDTEFGRERLSVDFSPESQHRQQIKQAIGAKIEAAPMREGSKAMKRTWKTGTKMILASAMAVVLLSATAFAITTLKLGLFAEFAQVSNEAAAEKVNQRRADWEGKVFDSNGKAIEDIANYSEGAVYDAQGRQVTLEWETDRFVVKAVSAESSASDASEIAAFATLEEAAPYLAFAPKLPQALPNGYALDRFELFRTNGGALPEAGKGKYLSVYYTKAGNADTYVYLQIRLMDAETAYAAGTDGTTREITINGYDAVTDGRSIDMLVGDVMYMFMPAKSGVAYDEILRMAESLK